jgi:hypothetical protein
MAERRTRARRMRRVHKPAIDPIGGMQVGCPLAAAIEDQELMPDQSPSAAVWPRNVQAARNVCTLLKVRQDRTRFWLRTRVTNYPDPRCVPAAEDGIVEDRDGDLWIEASSSCVRLSGSRRRIEGRDRTLRIGKRRGSVYALRVLHYR